MWWWAVQYRHLPTYDSNGDGKHPKALPEGPSIQCAGLCRALLVSCALVSSVLFVPMVHAAVVMARHSALVHTRMQAMGTRALGLAAESRPRTHVQPLPPPGLPGCAHAYVAGGRGRLAGPYALLASVTEVVHGGTTIDRYAMGALKLRVALGNRTRAAGIDTILLVPSTSAACVDAGRGGVGDGLHLAFLAGWDAVCCVAKEALGMDGQEDLRIVPGPIRQDMFFRFNRFLAWGLGGYKLVMYTDSDTAVLQPDGVVSAFPGVLRGMVDGGLSYACRKEGSKPHCNAGVFFARPSARAFQGILALARECYGQNARPMRTWYYTNSDGQATPVPSGRKAMFDACWSDQGILDAYFTRLLAWSDTQGRAQYPMPLSLNTLSYEAYEVFGARTVQDLSGVAILHFCKPKPWNVWECDTWWGLEGWCDLWRGQPLVMGQQPSYRPALPLAPAAQ